MVDIRLKKNTASREFLQIVWDVFFTQKRRGRSLKIHFPWLFDSSLTYCSFEMYENEEIVGGLVVVEKKVNDIKVALLGLVCIDEKHRGKGYLKKLMDSALSTIKKGNFDAIYLWTSQHDLYKRYDFQSIDNSILVKVRCAINSQIDTDNKIKIIERPDLSVPPFANSLYQFVTDEISIIYCEDDKTKYILSYAGELQEIIKKFGSFADDIFYINSFSNCEDQFLEAKEYADIEIKKQNIQMVNVLKTESLQTIKNTHFAANERI